MAAAVAGQRGLTEEPWPEGPVVRVRMGLHSGETESAGGSLVGLDINRASRIAGLAHGGQVLVSASTRALVGAALPEGATWRDLGEHRLRDIETPKRLWQVDVDGLPVDFPPLKSVGAPVGNMPTRLTSFVGRDEEVAELLALVGGRPPADPHRPGRHGQDPAVARDRCPERRPVPRRGLLRATSSPSRRQALVPAIIAERLGLPDRGGRAPVERLREYLRDRRLLIILDNFEQVIDAAPLVG